MFCLDILFSLAMPKALVFSAVSKAILQELLVPPSRISTPDLIQKFGLPSTLSQFQTLHISAATPREQGVHYLQYDSTPTPTSINSSSTTQFTFEAIYVNHGFGANSLSWLPVLPRLVDRMKAKRGLGHDATGFGFTDRPKRDPKTQSHLHIYTPKGSSEIGNTLLLQQAAVDESDKPVLLMGHSMGCLTTLHMATTLPNSMRKWVVLVSPALGVSPAERSKTNSKKSWIPRRIKDVGIAVVSVVGRYALRRVVG